MKAHQGPDATPAKARGTAQELAELSQTLAAEQLSPGQARGLAQQTAAIFMRGCLDGGTYLREAIGLLCHMATQPEESVSEIASRALFSGIVEPLNDSFDPRLSTFYDQVMAQVVLFCQSFPAGEALGQGLRRFGLATEDDLVARASGHRQITRRAHIGANIKKALVLSRVTLGADVAITSVLLAQLKRCCPQADLVLIGGDSLRELFGGDARIRLRPIAYDRQGSLLARLNAWAEVVSAIDEEVAGLKPEDWVVLDPDSRLSQLGLLPLVRDDSRYLLFPSRAYPPTDSRCLSELAADWLGTLSGTYQDSEPYMSLLPQDLSMGQRLLHWLRSGGKPLVAMNFAVSPNPQKGVGHLFEELLVRRLWASGAKIVLAKGGARDDMERAEALLGRLQSQGIAVARTGAKTVEQMVTKEPGGADILAWDGALGPYAALMGGADAYIGYDSACQHIAAALGVPVVDVFAGYPNATFVQRWRPYGPGPVRIVEAGAVEASRQGSQGLVDQVMAALSQMTAFL